MAEVSVPSIATVTATNSDKVVGVQTGSVKLFNVSDIRPGANPSVTVGLTAKNGTATTSMRSDGAPALDQAIAPTWTGLHKFSNGANVAGAFGVAANTNAPSPTNSGVAFGTSPTWSMASFYDQAVTANNRSADLLFITNSIKLRFANDARNAFLDVLTINGGQALGVTSITSTSGSGAWSHTGDFNATTVGASGFNKVTLAGAASGISPSIVADGGNVDVGLNIATKGAGALTIAANTSITGTLSVSGAFLAGSGTLPVYSSTGTTVTTPHAVSGTVALSGGNATVNLSGNAVFTNATSYVVMAVNQTTNSAVRATPTSGTQFTLNSGAGTDVIAYYCVGN